MCGIAGKINFGEHQNVPEQTLERMVAKLQHRGPDDRGIYVDRNIGLGHARLSIIDLSVRGHQPMSDADGKIWIVFNGEIYNFRELRQDLERDGIKFRSDTDTEAIIYLYKKYGVDCLQKLRGMFAFAIWDAAKRQLFIARDRVGKKPVKYYHDGSTFIFASELKAILENPEIPREVDWGAVDEFLTFQYVPSPKTGFKNIFKLEPAHYLVIKEDGTMTKTRYWDYQYTPKRSLSEAEWKRLLLDKLREAVRLRLVSDVPLGAHLSGGIDSSVIVALMAQEMKEPVKTFSIGFEEQSFNELPYARSVANRYGTNHKEFIVKSDAVSLMGALAYQYEEPFADPAALPTWYLSKMTRQQVTVALNGDGGDENFAGYDRYTAMHKFFKYRKALKFIPCKKQAAAINRILWHATRLKIFRRAWRMLDWYTGDPMAFYRNIIGYLEQKDKDLVYTDELRSRVSDSRWNTLLQDRDRQAKDLQLTDRLLFVDNATYLPDDLLVKVDIASMAHSLELRSPFLDHEFMQLAASMPPQYKLRGSNKKYLLKQIAYDLLPRECIDRPKQGFGVPLETWFKTSLYDYLKEQLLHPDFLVRGFSARGIEKLIEDHKQGSAINTNQLWALLNLRWWLKTWFE